MSHSITSNAPSSIPQNVDVSSLSSFFTHPSAQYVMFALNADTEENQEDEWRDAEWQKSPLFSHFVEKIFVERLIEIESNELKFGMIADDMKTTFLSCFYSTNSSFFFYFSETQQNDIVVQNNLK